MTAYIMKPIEMQRLANVVENLTLPSLPRTMLVNSEFAQFYSVLFGLFFASESCTLNTLNLENRAWTLHAH
jgi:hypothetical protein